MGQLDVTPEVVSGKINNVKENKSSGVHGISPKILKETVEQISTPLAHVFNMSLQEGIISIFAVSNAYYRHLTPAKD